MTMANDETKRAVVGYFEAWTHNKPAEARAFLADDLQFRGPGAEIDGADAFYPALVDFAAMTRGARVVDLVVQDDRAALLYDCDLPEAVGTLRIASFFRVEKGKIRTYDTRFDATLFAKLRAARQA
jgi:hypothetical protein